MLAACGGDQSSQSQSSLYTPQDITGPKMTDASQVNVDIHGPLDQFAHDAGIEVAKANALQFEARSQGTMTSTDPVLMGHLIDNYDKIAARWVTICRVGHVKRTPNAGRLERAAWKTGLKWCDLEVKLWTSVAKELRAALAGVPLTAQQRAQADATYRAAEAVAPRFVTAYRAYAADRG